MRWGMDGKGRVDSEEEEKRMRKGWGSTEVVVVVAVGGDFCPVFFLL